MFISSKLTQPRDVSRIDLSLRKNRDAIVISSPLSGLSNYLIQIKKHIQRSEHFEQIIPVFIDLRQFSDDEKNDVKGQIAHSCLRQLNMQKPITWSSEERLVEFFSLLLTTGQKMNVVFIIDNLQAAPENQIKLLFENIRVISDSRHQQPILNHVKFVLGGHSINLRKLDPKNNSPFNIAEKIWLDDFNSTQSLEFITGILSDSPWPISPLVFKYIDFLSCGHPYLTNKLCSCLINLDSILGAAPKKITFKIIDQVINSICDDHQDLLFVQLTKAVKSLPPEIFGVLQNILNGCRYDSLKVSPQVEELKLLGLINNSRSAIWHIRNPICDLFLRRGQLFKKLNSLFIPRRLFVNIEGYKILFLLENDLRDFIMSKLLLTYADKWTAKVDQNLLGRWRGLKNNELGSDWFSGEEFPEIAYSLFPDLKKIIEDNWAAIFHQYFKPRDIFLGYFSTLEVLRNKIAHNRSLNDQDIEQLELISERFQNCLFD